MMRAKSLKTKGVVAPVARLVAQQVAEVDVPAKKMTIWWKSQVKVTVSARATIPKEVTRKVTIAQTGILVIVMKIVVGVVVVLGATMTKMSTMTMKTATVEATKSPIMEWISYLSSKKEKMKVERHEMCSMTSTT